MNIAVLSYEYPPDTGFGGIGTYTYYHARALVKLGHAVHVFAGSTRNGTFHEEHDGVRITRIKAEGWLHQALLPARALHYDWFSNRVETASAACAALRDALHGEHFDIVEAPECGADAAIVSLRLNLPLCVRFHSPARLIMDGYQRPVIDCKLTGFVEQIAIDRADVRTSCSRFLAGEVQAKMGVPAPVHVIPNGIDVDLFDGSADVDVESRFGIPPGAFTVLFANRMEERKGVHLLADIAIPLMKAHSHVHFVLAGRDLFSYVAKTLLPRIREAGVEHRFHVVGALDHADVRALLKRAGVFLLPSLWENCPYSCIEAMTAGRAIVSSDCAGLPELIADRVNGLLVQTGDARSFATRLAELIDDGRLRERLGAAARRTVVERLTSVETARRTADLYRSMLSTASPQRASV